MVVYFKKAIPTREYRMCTRCVMDTTDSLIKFDEQGRCNWCNDYYHNILPVWEKEKQDPNALQALTKKIKQAGKDSEYDCIIGMSGGIDSSYLCYVAKELMGLRPLIYIVNTGWNLKIADDNIKKIIEGLELPYHEEVIDWEEMKDLQIAFFKSQVPYQDFPQDHVIFAGIYNYAAKHRIKYVLTGGNKATECIRPPMEWVYINDLRLMKDIQKRFGTKKLKKLPMCGMFKYRIIYPLFKGMKRAAPLDLVDYDKEKAKEFLAKQFGWTPYTNKHYEDVFTRWYEGFYLPEKFGYDKRKSYNTNLILTGKMTREEALEDLKKKPYEEELMVEDTRFIAEKLGMSVKEFERLISGDNKSYKDYKNSIVMIRLGTFVFRMLGIEKKQFR